MKAHPKVKNFTGLGVDILEIINSSSLSSSTSQEEWIQNFIKALGSEGNNFDYKTDFSWIKHGIKTCWKVYRLIADPNIYLLFDESGDGGLLLINDQDRTRRILHFVVGLGAGNSQVANNSLPTQIAITEGKIPGMNEIVKKTSLLIDADRYLLGQINFELLFDQATADWFNSPNFLTAIFFGEKSQPIRDAVDAIVGITDGRFDFAKKVNTAYNLGDAISIVEKAEESVIS